jgi:hypothetical protein
MNIVVYRPEEGGAPFKLLTGYTLEAAASFVFAEYGEGYLCHETEHRIDADVERLDLTADPIVIVSYVRTKSPEELQAEINRERDRRIAAGVTLNGISVTGSDKDRANLSDLAFAAQLRIASGDATTVTVFRDGDNIDHSLTPAELLTLWQQSAAYVSNLYAASWALKALDPIPQDISNPLYWPGA